MMTQAKSRCLRAASAWTDQAITRSMIWIAICAAKTNRRQSARAAATFLTRSPLARYRQSCQNEPKLTPEEHAGLAIADHDEIRKSLRFALRFDDRKRMHRAAELMAGITADHLTRYLERCGYVVMKKPEPPTAWISAHSTIPMKD
jgi:hypothetical protein